MVGERKDWADEKHRRIIEEQRRFLWTPEQLERLAAWVGLKPGMVLLDHGCGHCYLGRNFLPYILPGGRVVAVDREPALLATARRLADGDGHGDRFAFLGGEATAIPLADASVDVAYCQTLLMHLPEPEKALAEMVRVTKPGGVVACHEPNNAFFGLHYNSALPYDRDETLESWKDALIGYEGRKTRGRGDYAVGGRVPEMMRRLGLVDVDARMNEKVYFLVPPYATPFQQHFRQTIITEHDHADEWREEDLADYEAGGGSRENWEISWEKWKNRAQAFVDALKRDELFFTGGGLFYAFRGLKPVGHT